MCIKIRVAPEVIHILLFKRSNRLLDAPPEHIFTRKMLVGGKDPDPKSRSLAWHVIARVFSTCIKKYLTERDRQLKAYNREYLKWLSLN